MSPCHPFRPVPGQCGPNRRGPLPAPPFDPRDYWATRKLVSSLSGALEKKLDKADVVDPGAAAEAGKAADAKSTYEELGRILAKLAKKADKATTLAGYGITDAATKTEIAAKADLVGGKVPAAQLPSFVDDVLEYDSKSEFPASGENSKIYVAKDTNLVYRWSGTQYVEISPSPTLDDAVTEESPNGVKSSGIWSWVKSLLPKWLTSDYAEPATAASVAAKANKATPSAAGNLAALTADGNLADSGKTVGDFLPRVSNEPVRSTFDISGPLFLDMDGYIQLNTAGFIYGSFNNIREAGDSPISLRTELDSKVGSFESVGGASATVEDGVAKLDYFFTESNGLLTATIDDRLPIPISAKSAGFTTESYKRFIVTVSGDMTVTLHTPTSGDAEIFECRFNGASLSADASITFAGATATTMDANCGTVTAGKVALMSAFWNGTTWDVNWKVEG